MTPDELDDVAEHLGNYSSLEEHERADQFMDEIMDPERGWVEVFDDIAAVRRYLNGHDPVVSPLGGRLQGH